VRAGRESARSGLDAWLSALALQNPCNFRADTALRKERADFSGNNVANL